MKFLLIWLAAFIAVCYILGFVKGILSSHTRAVKALSRLGDILDILFLVVMISHFISLVRVMNTSYNEETIERNSLWTSVQSTLPTFLLTP